MVMKRKVNYHLRQGAVLPGFSGRRARVDFVGLWSPRGLLVLGTLLAEASQSCDRVLGRPGVRSLFERRKSRMAGGGA